MGRLQPPSCGGMAPVFLKLRVQMEVTVCGQGPDASHTGKQPQDSLHRIRDDFQSRCGSGEKSGPSFTGRLSRRLDIT